MLFTVKICLCFKKMEDYFPKCLQNFTLPSTTMHEMKVPIALNPYKHFELCLFYFTHCNGVKTVIVHCGFYLLFLMTNDTEHLSR